MNFGHPAVLLSERLVCGGDFVDLRRLYSAMRKATPIESFWERAIVHKRMFEICSMYTLTGDNSNILLFVLEITYLTYT